MGTIRSNLSSDGGSSGEGLAGGVLESVGCTEGDGESVGEGLGSGVLESGGIVGSGAGDCTDGRGEGATVGAGEGVGLGPGEGGLKKKANIAKTLIETVAIAPPTSIPFCPGGITVKLDFFGVELFDTTIVTFGENTVAGIGEVFDCKAQSISLALE